MVRNLRVAVMAAAALVAASSLVVAAGPAAAEPVTVGCEALTVDVPRDGVYSGSVSCTTSDGSPIESYALTSEPALGGIFLDPTTGAFTYTPDAGVTESDAFFFTATSSGVTSDEAVAMLNITNFAPSCSTPVTAAVPHDRALRIVPSCSDANNDTVTLRTGATAPAHGTLAVSGSALVYTPARGFVGTDTVTFDASDGEASAPAVTVTVSVTNAAPTCSVPGLTVAHDRAGTVTLTCRDADGDPVSVVAAAATRGTVSRVGLSSFRFLPARRFVGTASFTATVSDGLAATSRQVAVRVTNAAPRLAAPSAMSVRVRKVVRVVATDRDRDLVAVVLASRPRHGKVTIVGRNVTYVPAKRFRGRDTFSLRATDGIASSALSRVRVTVRR